jgi:hypothetical protein
VSAAAPGEAERAGANGRREVFVPVYPLVYTSDDARPFNLAVTLYVRNTDRTSPLFLRSVRLYDAGGKLVRDEVSAPLKVAPMAAAEFFVRESDVAAGSSASFLIEWAAPAELSEPVIEAVMVGTVMNQGVAFSSQGRRLERP